MRRRRPGPRLRQYAGKFFLIRTQRVSDEQANGATKCSCTDLGGLSRLARVCSVFLVFQKRISGEFMDILAYLHATNLAHMNQLHIPDRKSHIHRHLFHTYLGVVVVEEAGLPRMEGNRPHRS